MTTFAPLRRRSIGMAALCKNGKACARSLESLRNSLRKSVARLDQATPARQTTVIPVCHGSEADAPSEHCLHRGTLALTDPPLQTPADEQFPPGFECPARRFGIATPRPRRQLTGVHTFCIPSRDFRTA